MISHLFIQKQEHVAVCAVWRGLANDAQTDSGDVLQQIRTFLPGLCCWNKGYKTSMLFC